jgi:predicted small lipoprotein YifL
MLRQFRLTAVLAAALASAACGIKGPLVLPPAPAPAGAPPGTSATPPASPAAPGPATVTPTPPERKP